MVTLCAQRQARVKDQGTWQPKPEEPKDRPRNRRYQSFLALRGWAQAQIVECSANVRFGSKADIASIKRDVRFTPKSGH
jgi:hypothetical protein